MATISSSVQMYDNMSPVINGITNALNICISSFESMQAASSQSIDVTSMQAARQQLAGAQASFSQVEENIKNCGKSQNEFNHHMDTGHMNANNLLDSVKAITAGIIASKIAMAGLEGFANIFKSSDQLVQTSARLSLINDGLRTNEQLQTMIFQSAQRSRAQYSDTANVVAKLGTLAKGAFSSNEEMVAFAEQMNKQFKIGGASIEEQTAGMYQLTQAMASGKLQGDEFRSIMENAPLLAQAISTYTGKSMGDLRKMSAEGEITADIIKKALFATAEDTEARFAKIPKTTGEIWISIKNQALMAFQPVLLKINEIANNPNTMNFINMIVNGFVGISIAALNVINTISNIATFFQNNWSIIGPIIMGVVGAFLAYNTALLINNALTGISTGLKTIAAIQAIAHGAAITGEMLATTGMTGAQLAFNAALYACPITWIILLIIALIAIFYVAVGAVNKFAGTSYSATGIIAGAFLALLATIYNVVAFLYNIFAAFAEFFINVWSNPIEAVKRLFLNFDLAILNALIGLTKGFDQFATNFANAFVDGINWAMSAWNDFVDLLNSFGGIANKLGLGKGTTFQHTTSITAVYEDARNSIQDYLNTTPANYTKLSTMDSMNIGAAFDMGNAWGKNKEAWLGNLFNPPSMDQAQNNGFNYDDLLKNAKDTADNTGKMKDKLDITEEDLKYLRDIAEQDAINRFTTAEVKVEMTNQNTINSELDLDGIVNHLAGGLQESLQTVAEGATYSV